MGEPPRGDSRRSSEQRAHDHISLVAVGEHTDRMGPQWTIGRLIAQTALLADSAMSRASERQERASQRRPRARFGWFF